jgi:hypothetical protein
MRDLRIPLVVWLLMPALSGICSAADLFSSEDHRQAFLRVLARSDAQYDPAQQMLRGEFSSPGYHTTLQGGTVHRTCPSLGYAVALLDSGEPQRLARAQAILARVIALQDQDPNSPTYGIWPWFLEEPIEKMSPPDWNWADFCGVQLLQVAIDHMDRLPADVQQQVRNSILHAARSIRRRNVGPDYTNIALMGTYVTLVAGERLDDRDLLDYGKQRLRRFYDYTREMGSFTEYNSPTYTCVAIEEISRMLKHVQDKDSRELLSWLDSFAWGHVARRFHPPTGQWAGPHSRSYSTLLSPETVAFLQRGVGDTLRLMSEAEAWESLDAHRLDAQCPADLVAGFKPSDIERVVVESFVLKPAGEHDIVGRTFLHPAFTLGSVNIGDLWNQRRPLVGYWEESAGPAAVRLRMLHDGYDYASASLFTIQDKGDVLGAVLFATDRGDTHISLDKIANGTIRARDLRLRLQFEGAVDGLTLPERLVLEEPIPFASGPIEGMFVVHGVKFGDLSSHLEAGRGPNEAWIDVVLYHGSGRPFDFRSMEEAKIVFTLSIAPTGTAAKYTAPSVHSSVALDSLAAGIESPRELWTFQRRNGQTLSITIPTKPLTTKEQQAASCAKAGQENPWKATY